MGLLKDLCMEGWDETTAGLGGEGGADTHLHAPERHKDVQDGKRC